MPRDAGGTYTLPIAPFVPLTLAKSADMNTALTDIASALTDSQSRASPTPAQADLDMNGQDIVNADDIHAVTAEVSGALSVGGDLGVTGSASVGGNVGVNGDVGVAGKVLVDGDLDAGPTTVTGTLGVSGGASFGGNVGVQGNVGIGGTLTVGTVYPFPDNTAALASGLPAGTIYFNTGVGALSVVIQ